MVDTILGTRIRQRRREIGLTQAALAKHVGISPSYLNLIEWNKRRIGGGLLNRIAEQLDLGLDALGGIAEKRLHESLTEIAQLPALDGVEPEKDGAGELIARFPGWARTVVSLARAEREASARAQVLSDRLANDPFLGESIHRMLTRLSAIRAASEILVEYPDATMNERQRFSDIIHEEVGSLSDVGEALASYLDKTEHAERILTPIDEVEALFDSCDNRFPEIEAVTLELSAKLTDPQPVARREKARLLTEELVNPLIADIIEQHPEVDTKAAQDRAHRMLTDYTIGAILMPMDRFIMETETLKFDVEALADNFSTDVQAVCHRLTAIPRVTGRPRFGYLQANAAGTIVEMLALEGLTIPRYAAACPLWVLFRAQQSPEAVIRQRVVFPSGGRFVFIARARNTGQSGFGKPRHYQTDMLVMTELDASQTVYAPDPSAVIEEVGPSCRLCSRHLCQHRVEDPLIQ